MEIKKLQEFYKLLYKMFYYDSRARQLSMVENEISRSYLSLVAKLKRYLVQNYYQYGVTDVTADQMFDERQMKFIGLNEYSFITPSRDSTLAAIDNDVQKHGSAKLRVLKDYHDTFYPIVLCSNDALSILNQNYYPLSSTQKEKIKLLLRTEDIANGKGTRSELEEGRLNFAELISIFIDFLYKHLNANGCSQEFCPLVETAFIDSIDTDEYDKTKYLVALKRYNVPKRNPTFVRFKYAN